MTKENAMAIASGYFKIYPDAKEFFFTEDKQAFFLEADARSHAQELGKGKNSIIKIALDEKPEEAKKEEEEIPTTDEPKS